METSYAEADSGVRDQNRSKVCERARHNADLTGQQIETQLPNNATTVTLCLK